VPTFIFDGQFTISGAQEPDVLVQIFDQVSGFAAAREAAT
jgi:predicted DsbA family dithiol-disulfide isomerase